jgi:8-oxo-dGTP pyrophosphatase MutT (NUDIX family)
MPKRVVQAGAIVYRTDDGVRILLVRDTNDKAWVFPKGHLKHREPLCKAALREAQEEAGVVGRIVSRLRPPLEFRSKDEDVRVHYFLVERTGSVEKHEPREHIWLSPTDALERVTHQDARRLLGSALFDVEFETGQLLSPPERAPDLVKALMAQEHEHLAESLLRNEESGERRVTVFLSILTGLGGVIGYLGLKENALEPGAANVLVLMLLVIAIAMGGVTMVRIITRNAASDRYKEGLSRVRRFAVGAAASPYARYLFVDPFTNQRRPRFEWRRARGGWLETVMVIEVLLIGLFVVVLLWAPFGQFAAVFGLAAAGLSAYALSRLANAVYERQP